MKNITAIFICALFAIFLSSGCSKKEDDELLKKSFSDIHEKILKERKQQEERAKYDKAIRDEKVRGKYLAVAEACNKQYSSCIDKCKDSKCEDVCLKNLSACEKDIPKDLQTLK